MRSTLARPRPDDPATPDRRTRWRIAVVLLLVGSGVAVGTVGSPAPASAAGTALVTESFTGPTVADDAWRALGSACLTAATDPAPAGELGACAGSEHAPAPGVTPGYLQLTDDRSYSVGGVLTNQAFPGNGGAVVTFDQWQYGGNGADGIGFFLTDGSADLTSAGGKGGSLGYAPINTDPGVAKGYLGLGLDAYGNYTNPTEQRDRLCPAEQTGPGSVPNAVSLRGPGDGRTGYCWLAGTVGPDGTSTLPGPLRGSDAGDASARSVRITIAPESRPLVTVEMDFHDDRGWQEVFRHRMDVDAPQTYKLGLLASTGGLTDTHVIRNLAVSSVVPLGRMNLTAEVVDPAERYAAGDRIRYRFLVSNTSELAPLTDVSVVDAGVPDLTCPATRLGHAGGADASMTCTGTHVVTAEDVRHDAFTRTVHATGKDGANTVTSAPVTARVALVRDVAELAVVTSATLDDRNGNGLADEGETVTTRTTVTNTGTRTLTDLDLAGSLPAAGRGGPFATLAPGDSTVITGTTTVARADTERGTPLVDSVTVRATDPTGDVVSASATSQTIPVAAAAPIDPEQPGPAPSPSTRPEPGTQPEPGDGATTTPTTGPTPVPGGAPPGPAATAPPGPGNRPAATPTAVPTRGVGSATAAPVVDETGSGRTAGERATTRTGRLAFTGVELAGTGTAALVLVALGAGLLVARTRRRRARHTDQPTD